ncbi:hypothetical protein [Rhodanobacter lindaniclasticus]
MRTRAGQPVQVEVVLHTRFKRCSGPMALGDVVYTTTLLPGEKVRLATTDRRGIRPPRARTPRRRSPTTSCR